MYNIYIYEKNNKGKSLEDIKSFPVEAKREAGHQLDKIQRGQDPLDWKPMQSIGPNVREIRIRISEGIFRVIYLAKFEEAIYVLHAFQKKTEATSNPDRDIARRAYKKLLEERNHG